MASNERNMTQEEKDARACCTPSPVQPGMDGWERRYPLPAPPSNPSKRDIAIALRRRAEDIRAGDRLTADYLVRSAEIIEGLLFEMSLEAAFQRDEVQREAL